MSRLQVVYPTREKARGKYTHTRETLEDTRHEGSAQCGVYILLALLSLVEIGDLLLSIVVVKVINAVNCGNQFVASNF